MLSYPCFHIFPHSRGTSLFIPTPAFKLFRIPGVVVCVFLPLLSSFFAFQGYKFVFSYPCFQDSPYFGGTNLFFPTPAFRILRILGVQICSFLPLFSRFFAFRGYAFVFPYPCFHAFSHSGGTSLFFPTPVFTLFRIPGVRVCFSLPLLVVFSLFRGWRYCHSFL